MSNSSETTRDRLIRLVRQHPDWTVRDYAALLGVSPSRVHQLLTAIGARQQWVLTGNETD